jgi:hypothetical protein
VEDGAAEGGNTRETCTWGRKIQSVSEAVIKAALGLGLHQNRGMTLR